MQWEKSDILVMKEVRVRSPYLSDCVFGGTDAANNRVKKVVSTSFLLFVKQASLCVIINANGYPSTQLELVRRRLQLVGT